MFPHLKKIKMEPKIKEIPSNPNDSSQNDQLLHITYLDHRAQSILMTPPEIVNLLI